MVVGLKKRLLYIEKLNNTVDGHNSTTLGKFQNWICRRQHSPALKELLIKNANFEIGFAEGSTARLLRNF